MGKCSYTKIGELGSFQQTERGNKMSQLQQVKIMFTPEAAHKISAACKGSSVTPLDSENQRVFNDVFEHGVDGEYYTVELNSGKGFSYPNRNIERVRSAWQDEPAVTVEQIEADLAAIDNGTFDAELAAELAAEHAALDAQLEVDLAEIEADYQVELADIMASV